MVKNILITGASGLIGTRLTTLLDEEGYRIAHLSRTPRSGNAETFLWNVDKHQLDAAAIQAAHVVIHLAGTGIADKPWTKQRKNEIIKSRTLSTRLLYGELKKGNHNVKTFISSSAIGFYGSEDKDTFFTEDDKQGNDFLSDVVGQWEQAVDQISELGIRVVKLRIGIVLSEKGGALKEMMRPIKLYVGAPLGTGTQYLSWIHLDDVCYIFIKAIEDETMHGVYNAVAPNPVTNKEFTHSVAKALHRPVIFPTVPSVILKIFLGERADLVLKGTKISGEKIQATGFKFRFDSLDDALRNILTNG